MVKENEYWEVETKTTILSQWVEDYIESVSGCLIWVLKKEWQTDLSDWGLLANIKSYEDDEDFLDMSKSVNYLKDWGLIENIKCYGIDDYDFSADRKEKTIEFLLTQKQCNFLWNQLHHFSINELELIFSSLDNVKSLNLSENNLWELDNKSLQIIFENLNNSRKIVLKYTNLSSEQKEFIRILVPNTILIFEKPLNDYKN